MSIVRPITRPVTRPPTGYVVGGDFDPGLIARRSEAIFDDSDLTSMFVEIDGSGGNPSPGETVGLQLDKSHMGGMTAAAYIDSRPELYPGTKTSGAGWTDNGDDTYTKTAGAANEQRFLVGDETLIEGEFYQVSFTTDQDAFVFMYLGGPEITVNRFSVLTAGDHSGIVRAESLSSNDSVRFNTADDVTISNISIKHIPGQHRTAAADNERPVLDRRPATGRRNLLVSTNDLTDVSFWNRSANPVVNLSSEIGPNGGAAFEVTAVGPDSGIWQAVSAAEGETFAGSFYMKILGNADTLDIKLRRGSNSQAFASTTHTLTSEWQRVDVTGTVPVGQTSIQLSLGGGASFSIGETVLVSEPQLELGSTATPYQRVTNDNDITETGKRSVYSLAYDGVDDGLSFDFEGGAGPADCSVFFAVKTTDDIFGIGRSDGSEYLLRASDGAISTSISSGSGSPSYYIEGLLQSWTTRGDAHTSLSTGSYVNVEVRNADLNLWAEFRDSDTAASTFSTEGNLIGPIIVPTSKLTNSLRRSIETYLKRKAGIL